MKTKKLNINHLIVHLILLAGVAVVVFPFLWMILTSFKTSGEAMKIPPTIFPEKFVTTAYHTIVSSAIPFGTVYMNTIISTVVTTIVQIAFCSMAGYAFGRIDFLCTYGSGTDFPDSAVSDYPENGITGYHSGFIYAKSV